MTNETTDSVRPVIENGGGPPLLELCKIVKRFPGVNALADVDFDLEPGEVHVLFGENGAGKSTLINIISGAQRPTSGTINVRGVSLEFSSVQHARALGINAVYQEFSLVPQLTIAENIFLGAENARHGFIDNRQIETEAGEILQRLGFPLNPQHRVVYLSRAEQQMVEIAKAFRSTPSILILDEPTASLTERETDRLFSLIATAKNDGVGIIYITHRMGEIRRIGDRVTVLRDGRKIATLSASETNDEKLVELMTGRVITQIFPHIEYRPGEVRLRVSGLSTSRRTIQNVNLEVRSGEVVGIAGLVGSGKGDVARACFGLEGIAAGEICFEGQPITKISPREMLRKGLYYLPSDRRREGLVLNRGARENIALADLSQSALSWRGFLKLSAEKTRTEELARRVELRPLDLEKEVEQFSGGNQQKIMIAKALARNARVVIFDEPTVGVDVGTRVAIYGFIRGLCESGAGILLISSDLPEILYLAHRAYVMYRGEMCTELQKQEITEENVLRHFFERE